MNNNSSTQKVIFTIGLPGSGKTTWAKDYISKNQNTYIICKDDLREMMISSWSSSKEKIIKKSRNSLLKELLSSGCNAIICDTGFGNNIKEIQDVINSVNPKILLEEKSFLDVPLDICILRDSQRAKPVGKEVIMKFYNQYVAPNVISVVHDPMLESAVIVDMDGTLAHMKDRNPYDFTKVGNDIIDPTIAKLTQILANDYKIIIVSGREDTCKTETEEWLVKNSIPYSGIFMRASKDHRPDSIVKEELYKENIEGKYNVFLVLDDRDSVVKTWRKLGLKCLQVAEGNF